MEKTCAWENEDGWKLLQKWFHSSCEISVAAGGMLSDRRFAIKRGLITHLDPSRIRIRGDGQEHELVFSEKPFEAPRFEDVWSAELASIIPEVRGIFPEAVRVESGFETWRFTGPVEIQGKS